MWSLLIWLQGNEYVDVNLVNVIFVDLTPRQWVFWCELGKCDLWSYNLPGGMCLSEDDLGIFYIQIIHLHNDYILLISFDKLMFVFILFCVTFSSPSPPFLDVYIFGSMLEQLTAYRYILIYLSLILLILRAFLICLPLNFHSHFLLTLVFVGGVAFSLNVVFF